MKIALELGVIIEDLNISAEAFEKWKAAALDKARGSGAPQPHGLRKNKPEMSIGHADKPQT